MKEKVIEKIKILGIIILLTILISIPYLNFEDIFVHDISYHTNRIVCISEELKMRQFPVLIHSNLLDGFGYANSLFYPEIFLYIPAVLVLLGIDFLTSYKLFTMITTFFTLLFTYYSANRIFKKKNVAWVISLLYGTAFYRLTDIYIRGAIGEVLAIVFLPLILCGIYEIIFGENKNWWLICFGIFGVINSHVLSFVMVVILILILCLFNVMKIFKDKKRIINLVLAGVISILLIFSFVLPYLEQSNSDKFNVDEKIYNGEFLASYAVSFKEMLSKSLTDSECYKSIGILLLVLPMFIVMCKNKDTETLFMKQLFGIGLILLFMTTSVFPWEKLCSEFNTITTIQFPYRLNIIITVIFSFVGGYALCEIINHKEELNKLLYIALILFTLNLFSSLDINPNEFTKDMILEYAPVGNGEYKPYGLKTKDTKVHNIANETEIEFRKFSSKLEFNYINSIDEMIIHIPLAYYKGYSSYIEDENGNRTKLILEEDPKSKNIIVKNDKIINGKITVEYKMTIIQKIGYIITYATLICLIGYIIYNYRKNKTLEKPKSLC